VKSSNHKTYNINKKNEGYVSRVEYVDKSCHQNAGQNHNMTANKSFENVAKFRYMGMNICYYSVQNHLPASYKKL
jgi:hypothetical protein